MIVVIFAASQNGTDAVADSSDNQLTGIPVGSNQCHAIVSIILSDLSTFGGKNQLAIQRPSDKSTIIFCNIIKQIFRSQTVLDFLRCYIRTRISAVDIDIDGEDIFVFKYTGPFLSADATIIVFGILCICCFCVKIFLSFFLLVKNMRQKVAILEGKRSFLTALAAVVVGGFFSAGCCVAQIFLTDRYLVEHMRMQFWNFFGDFDTAFCTLAMTFASRGFSCGIINDPLIERVPESIAFSRTADSASLRRSAGCRFPRVPENRTCSSVTSCTDLERSAGCRFPRVAESITFGHAADSASFRRGAGRRYPRVAESIAFGRTADSAGLRSGAGSSTPRVPECFAFGHTAFRASFRRGASRRFPFMRTFSTRSERKEQQCDENEGEEESKKFFHGISFLPIFWHKRGVRKSMIFLTAQKQKLFQGRNDKKAKKEVVKKTIPFLTTSILKL